MCHLDLLIEGRILRKEKNENPISMTMPSPSNKGRERTVREGLYCAA